MSVFTQKPRKLILKSFQSLGDMVVLSAAIRDLHRIYPFRFRTDVRTAIPELWWNNPYIAPIADDDPDAELIDMGYPLINLSNGTPWHFVHAYGQMLGDRLGLSIPPTEFKGDVYLTQRDREIFDGQHANYWVIVAGGKDDFTIKWWSHERWQAVVDHFRGKIQFVQVGLAGHSHKPLNGVVNLLGKTSVRGLIRVIHHASGVLCPVTGVMHLAAAVPVKQGEPPNRPCVVVAGAREGSTWEAYPTHQFLHNCGALPCAPWGGCWKSRTVPLGDGDEKDQHLCEQPLRMGEETLPKCMAMIEPHHVIDAIMHYFWGGMCSYLDGTGTDL